MCFNHFRWFINTHPFHEIYRRFSLSFWWHSIFVRELASYFGGPRQNCIFFEILTSELFSEISKKNSYSHSHSRGFICKSGPCSITFYMRPQFYKGAELALSIKGFKVFWNLKNSNVQKVKYRKLPQLAYSSIRSHPFIVFTRFFSILFLKKSSGHYNSRSFNS